MLGVVRKLPGCGFCSGKFVKVRRSPQGPPLMIELLLRGVAQGEEGEHSFVLGYPCGTPHLSKGDYLSPKKGNIRIHLRLHASSSPRLLGYFYPNSFTCEFTFVIAFALEVTYCII